MVERFLAITRFRYGLDQGDLMLDRTEQVRIGQELRAMYESIPKGGIPDRIWRLLLSVEREEMHRRAMEERQQRNRVREDRVWAG